MVRNVFVIVLTGALCGVAWGQDKWLLTTAQFRTESVVLKGIGANGIDVVPSEGGGDRIIALDDFLDLSRTLPAAQSAGKFVLHMSGGDSLAGSPVSLKGDSLVWKNDALGEIEIPGSKMVAMTLPGKSAPTERPHEDVVTLANGDAVRGIIAAIAQDKITVQTSGGNTDVPISSVAAISFAATPGNGAAQRGFRVRLDDNSSLVGSAAKLEGDSLVLTLGKNADRKIALAHVTSIEQVNGPVSWLSARAPAEAVYHRLMGGAIEPAAYMDKSWLGQRGIEFKGRPFAHGIAVHAYSQLTWKLDGTYEAFRTRYAIEGDSGLADATVRILLDGKTAYEKQHVRSGVLSPVVLLDLAGAKTLTLEVDGGTAYAQDTLDWIEPALLKKKPTEPPPAEPDATEPTTGPATQPAGK